MRVQLVDDVDIRTADGNELVNAYWKFRFDGEELVFDQPTKALCETFNVATSQLRKAVKENVAELVVSFKCPCGSPLVHRVTVRSRSDLEGSLAQFHGRRRVCRACFEKHEQQRRERTERQRLKKEDMAALLYGKRFCGVCPQCSRGIVLLKVNSKTLELYKGCTQWNCYMQALLPEEVEQQRANFLEELHRAWRTSEGQGPRAG